MAYSIVSQEWRNGAASQTRIVSKFYQMAAVPLSTPAEEDWEVKEEPTKEENDGIKKVAREERNCRLPVVDSNEGPK